MSTSLNQGHGMFRAVIKLWRKLQFHKESFMLSKTENNLDVC